jgi:amino acid transporter
MLWLRYLVTISLYATAFASYAATFFKEPVPFWLEHAFITVAILLPMFINLVSASFVSKSETVFVFIKVTLLLLIITSGIFFVDTERLSPTHWEAPMAIVTAGMIIFVAYEGFELIANAAEDIIEPEKNLPRAFYGSVFFVLFLYVMISVVTVGVVPAEKLIEAKDYALAIAAEPALGHIGFTLVAVAALLSTFSAINATIYGNARLGYKLAQNGRLPHSLANEKRHIPGVGVIVTSILSIVLANTISLTEIAIIGSAGFLLIFFIVNIAAYKMRERIYARGGVLLLGIVLSGSALVTLLYHTYSTDLRASIVFFSFIIVSIVFEFFYGRYVRGQFFERQY